MTFWLIVLAGALGAAMRYVVDGALRAKWPTTLPAATLTVNVLGSAVLGAVMGAGPHTDWAAIAGMGWCGGFTTFSTHIVETLHLASHTSRAKALANLFLMLVACTFAAGLLFWLIA
ncbi:CrcB protein [Actinocorallia herbida]|uniref:Fluoride-specific ion channel FluC n=1 Tax=Actinocorallia herbida TaxID=58109 RepID=A0A3N1D2H7_9ACTN|nr:CrcB family protein [Actinocorallia herbida]ROO87690.1 CrcB protein [Actinocorallia herbida]